MYEYTEASMWLSNKSIVAATGVEMKELGAVHLDGPERGEINLERREGRGDRPHDGTGRLGIE